MKRFFTNIFSLCIIVILTFISCNISKGIKHNDSDVLFEIIQDGNLVRSKDNTFYLKKAPFTIRLKMINADGVYVSTSFIEDYYNLPDSVGIEWLQAKVLPELGKNEEKQIYIDTTGFHFWCNCPEDLPPYFFNKFNDVKTSGDTIIGERMVGNYYDGKENKITQIDKDIYVLALLMEHEDHIPTKELKRIKFIIRWY